MNCAELFRKAARHYADNEAIWCGGESLTYREVYERACRLSNGLVSVGLGKGDVVATLGPNSLYSLEQMAALSIGGYARLPLHGRNTVEQHRQMLSLVRARALLVDASSYDAVADLPREVETLEHVFVVEGTGEGSYEKLIAGAAAEDRGPSIDPGDISHFAFTSGTTGVPKAAVHTHRSWLAVMEQYLLSLGALGEQDRYLAVAPLSHAASTVLYGVIARGGGCVAMRSFDPREALEQIAERRISFILLVPTMLQMLLDAALDDDDLESLRILLITGAPLSETTLQRARRRFGEVLYQSYGQSEGVPFTVMTPADYERASEPGRERLMRAVGRPTVGTSVRIVDRDGNAVPAGEEGEIVADSPTMMRGFWENDAATAERLTEDGALLTRDVGFLDADGYLFISDRQEDMIISGGYNIWPAELENAIAAHPEVVEVCVFGAPHERWGETPYAVVVRKEGSQLAEQDLIAYCSGRIGSMKKPARVLFDPGPLPTSSVGKLLRRKLRDSYLGDAGTAALPGA